MDLFHDNPMFPAVRQMLGAFAKNMIRPIATKHDQEESMPWDLMKFAQSFGLTQTQVLDGRKQLTGQADESESDPSKPKTQARLGVVGAEELAYGCAGICLAIGGSGLAGSPVARMGTDEQKAEFRKALSVRHAGAARRVRQALRRRPCPLAFCDRATCKRASARHWSHDAVDAAKRRDRIGRPRHRAQRPLFVA